MIISDWIQQNDLQVSWIIDQKIFSIQDKKYIVIQPKEQKIFDEQFEIIFDDEEIQLIESEQVTYCVFKFGKYFYYSKAYESVKLSLFRHIGKSEHVGLANLGIHGGYEICNGSGSYLDWCNKAKFLSVNTLGICERNTLAGTLKFQLTCKEQAIHSIIGETVLVKDANKNTYYVKLFCIDSVGWNNLLWINKAINVDNCNDKHVPEEYLLERTKGLIVVLGSDLLLTEELMDKYKGITNLYYQIDTVSWKAGERDKKHLVNLKNYYDNFSVFISPIVLCDSYYLDQQDHFVKDLLNKIGKAGFENQSESQHFKNEQEIKQEVLRWFANKPDQGQRFWNNATSSLNKICDLCKFQIKTGEFYLPKYKLNEEESSKFKNDIDLFWSLIDKGMEDKVIAKDKDAGKYFSRVETEYEIIEEGKLQSYFLILYDIIKWAKENNILVGYGRGSVGGSLIAGLIGVTEVDPIKYDLLYERFINRGRLLKTVKEEFILCQGSDGEYKEFNANDWIEVEREGERFKIKALELVENDHIL